GPECADVDRLTAGRGIESGAVERHPRAVVAPLDGGDRRIELAEIGIVVVEAIGHTYSSSVSDYLTPPLERKGREGRKEILSCFASFATSAFNRDVRSSHDDQRRTRGTRRENRSSSASSAVSALNVA